MIPQPRIRPTVIVLLFLGTVLWVGTPFATGEGLLPFADGPGSADPEDKPIRNEPYNDFHLMCDEASPDGDINRDDVQDLLDHVSPVEGHDTWRTSGNSTVKVLSGAHGGDLWNRSDLKPWFVGGPLGNPPAPLNEALGNFFPTPDLDGDGVCDLLMYGWYKYVKDYIPGIFLFGEHLEETYGTLRLMSGVDGHDLWNQSLIYRTRGGWFHSEYKNFFHGLLFIKDAPAHRFAYTISDYEYHYNKGGRREEIHFADAATGKDLWVRTYGSLPEDNILNAANTEPQTWLFNATGPVGHGDFNGDGVEDLLLSQSQTWTNKRLESPETYDRHEGLIQLIALDGRDGAILWNTTVWNYQDQWWVSGLGQEEEPCEVVEERFTRIHRDFTLDGRPDPIFHYYTTEGYIKEGRCETTYKDARTHVVPVDGKTGKKYWDQTAQGRGYTDVLTPFDGESQPYIALGTIDPIGYGGRGARFPVNLVRLTVLRLEDGSPVWSYRERFAQDSSLSGKLAFVQFFRYLAPFDYDGDGLNDLLTPAQYVMPGALQVFLSTATSEYQIISGKDGSVLKTLSFWGSNSMAVPCEENLHEVTVVAGHGRRLDVIRVDAHTKERVWRQPVYNDPVVYPAVMGVELDRLGMVCDHDASKRAFFALNMGVTTYFKNRGSERFPVYGFELPQADLDWIRPDLEGEPPEDALLEVPVDLPSPDGLVLPPWGKNVARGLPLAPFGFLAALGVFRPSRRGPSPPRIGGLP